MANPSAARAVPIRKAGSNTHPFQEKRKPGDPQFLQLPYGAVDEIFRKLTNIEAYVYLRVAEETVYQESAVFVEATLAKRINATPEGIRLALVALEKHALIPRRVRDGRGVRIGRPSVDALKRMPVRDARKCRRIERPEPAPDEGSNDTETAPAPKPQPAALTCPIGHECPVTSVVKINGLFTNTPTGVGVSPSLRPTEETPTGVGVSPSLRPTEETPTGVGVSPSVRPAKSPPKNGHKAARIKEDEPVAVAVVDPDRERTYDRFRQIVGGCGKPVSVEAESDCRAEFFKYTFDQQLHIVEDALVRAEEVWNKPRWTPDPLQYLQSRDWILKPIKRRTLPSTDRKTKEQQLDESNQRLIQRARERDKQRGGPIR
jgi:hypothetical protein